MKRFIYKTSVFFGLFIFLIVGTIYHLNSKMNDERFYKIPESNDRLIFGHSHPETAFNDSLISRSSNFGYSGESYFYTYQKVKKLTTSNPQVKTVFIDFSNNLIEKSADELVWGRTSISWAFPKFSHLFDVEDYLLLYSKNTKSTMNAQSLTVQNNYNFIYRVKGASLIWYRNMGGFLRLTNDGSSSLAGSGAVSVPDTLFETSETNIEYLKKAVQILRAREIDIYLVRTPVHKSYPGRVNEKTLINIKKTEFEDVDFLDFLDFQVEDNEFADAHHLNFRGANKFSAFFNRLLDDGLLSKEDKQQYINTEMSKIFPGDNRFVLSSN